MAGAIHPVDRQDSSLPIRHQGQPVERVGRDQTIQNLRQTRLVQRFDKREPGDRQHISVPLIGEMIEGLDRFDGRALGSIVEESRQFDRGCAEQPASNQHEGKEKNQNPERQVKQRTTADESTKLRWMVVLHGCVSQGVTGSAEAASAYTYY